MATVVEGDLTFTVYLTLDDNAPLMVPHACQMRQQDGNLTKTGEIVSLRDTP